MKTHVICKILVSIIFACLLAVSLPACKADAGQPEPYDQELAPYGSVITRDLSTGMTGADVAALQSMLLDLGYLSEDIDGCFGQETLSAVISFQEDHEGLNADGVVNRDTLQALNTILLELIDNQIVFIYDTVIPAGSSCTVSPYFSDDQEHTVTLSGKSSLISIYGLTISGLYPGSTEVSAECEGQVFKFYAVVRNEADINKKAGNLTNANNINKGFSSRLENLEPLTDRLGSMIMFAGDCFLDERLWMPDYETRFAGSNVYSIALSGSTAKQWKKMIPKVYQYAPSSLVFTIGINDLRHGDSVPAAINSLEELFEMIRQNMPDTTIYWMNLMPHLDSPEQYYKIAAVNAAVKDYFKDDSKVVVVDANAALSDSKGIADSSLFLDTLHPNAEGYDRLFQKAAEAGLEF